MKRGLNKENSLPDPEFGGESSESARAIHYVVQKDTLMTYEKGLFAQADPGIVSGSTIERKQMSTKTIYKRIALVAVTALGAGVLSVAPASAAEISGAFTSINLKTATASPTVGAAVDVNLGGATASKTGLTAGDTAKVTGFLSSYPASGFVTTSAVATVAGATATKPTGVTAAPTPSAGTLPFASAGTTFGGNTVTATATVGFGSYTFTPTVAGTYVMTVWNDVDADGVIDVTEARQDVSITVVAASALSSGTSTAFIRGDNTATAANATTDALPASATATAGAANSAAITVSLKNAANVAMTSGNTLSATLTGPGYLLWASADDAPQTNQCSATPTYAATLGRSVTAQAADADGTLYVCADGASGVATIAITATNTASGVSITLPSKTVTFYGAVTKIVATGVLTVGRAGGYAVGVNTGNRAAATDVPSVIIKATDKNGVPVGGLTAGFSVKSSAITVMTETITNNPDTAGATYSSGGLGFYNVQTNTASSAKSGDKATLTFRVLDPADPLGLAYLTSTVDFTIGGSVATEVLSFDKTSYAPGDPMIVTVTAKDSAGNPVYDGAASPAISFSKAVGGTAPAASVYVGGKRSNAANTVFAPVTTGAFSALATSGNAAGSAITAASTVAPSADLAAITTLVNSLLAKINALNKLVIKIQKKVRA
jgi:trimeric autotransporter adhesin